jgi:hypothetical protein
MPDQYIEDLPDGGDLQATDLLYVQRNIGGQWFDFNIEAGAVNATPVQVHHAVYTEADVVGAEIVMFTPAAGEVAVFLDAFVKLETPIPTGLVETIQIGSVPDQLTCTFTNNSTTQYLSFASAAADCVQSQAAIEVGTNIAAINFTLTITTRYVLVSV